MLSRTTLRTKLILLALIPLVAVFVMAGRSVRADFARASAASAQSAEVDRASRIYDIARALERELLVDRLVAPSSGEEPNAVSPRGLDNAIDAFLADPASADDGTVAAIEAFDLRLPALRSALRATDAEIFAALVHARDTLAADPGAAASAPETPNLETAALEWTAFTRLIDGEQDFDTSIFTDSSTTEDALTLEMTAALREAVALQGASFSSLLTSPKVTPELLVAAAQAAAGAEKAQADLLKFGSDDFISLVQTNGGAEISNRIAANADEVLAQPVAMAPSVNVTTVRPAFLSADQQLIGAVDVLFGELTDAVTATESAARSSAITTLLLLALMTLAILLLVMFLYRSIRRPLQRVTERSRDIANVQLPGVVATMRADVDADLPEVDAIPVTSHDEIGELVTAFNLMSSTAVGLVGEQAAARRSIADMFMNLGRRNQKLLNRLLRNLDRLERDEEDPDVLAALYDIDHITTRMRRNAESLLVLAGAEQSRSFNKPAAVGDVVRAALAEVENFQRVNVIGEGQQLLTGECVADVAHLIAELLENGLAFSPPETMVQVTTRMTPRGYIIVVTDNGVGMSADKLAESNQRIASALSKEETPSKFLGLFVVGRLAARRGISVELFESPTGGVTARVTLPASALYVDPSDPASINGAVVNAAGVNGAGIDGSGMSAGVNGATNVVAQELFAAPRVPSPKALPPDLPVRRPAAATTVSPDRGMEWPAAVPAVAVSPTAISAGDAVPLLVPPTLSDAPFAAAPSLAAPSGPSSPAEAPAHRASRPNRFGTVGRSPGAHLPRTVVEPADGAPVDIDGVNGNQKENRDGDGGHGRDAVTVQRSLASFQTGTSQADQRQKAEEIAGMS